MVTRRGYRRVEWLFSDKPCRRQEQSTFASSVESAQYDMSKARKFGTVDELHKRAKKPGNLSRACSSVHPKLLLTMRSSSSIGKLTGMSSCDVHSQTQLISVRSLHMSKMSDLQADSSVRNSSAPTRQEIFLREEYNILLMSLWTYSFCSQLPHYKSQ